MNENMNEYFKAFSDKNRLKIIELLLKGETCGCTLIDKLPISQPTLSYHLKALVDTGLANKKREGNWMKHFIDRTKIEEMIQYLQELLDMEALQCSL